MCGEAVTGGVLDFVDQAVSAEDAQKAAGPGGKTTGLGWSERRSVGIEALADVAVAEAGDTELAMLVRDRFRE